MLERIRAWWAAEGALVELRGLSDRMLADMGLEREGLRERVLGRSGAAPPARGRGCGVPAPGPIAAR